ncbi:MAG: acyl-CoA dehydrogenase family protein, partial [Blastocatellia bacterium]|nr:acyl-CoA dehydrogenase family protein [Blastocatellia bacterium]
MNLNFTEEQTMARDTVREFAKAEIALRAREYDEAEKFPKEQLDGLAELGILGMIIPEEYGGAGFDTVSYALALEENRQSRCVRCRHRF